METIRMGVRDVRRLDELQAALRGSITNRQGAERLGISVRQFKRLRKRVAERGARGLVHGNRGRPSRRRLSAEVRERVMALLTEVRVRVNDHHISDLLREEGHRVSSDSVRRIRRELQLPPKQRRRPPRHHRRRAREARQGSMVLIDGSPYCWLGPELGERTLIGTVDDADGQPLALTFRPEEDLHGYATVLDRTIRKFGVPGTLYGDRTGIAIRNDKHWTIDEELAGRQTPTQFGQMLEDLGIRYIAAHSPQAKGRIERVWRTLQDRLPAELALKGITTWEAAEAYLPIFMSKFKAAPLRDTVTAWRSAPPHLERLIACRYQRTVGRDNVVSFYRMPIQIPPGPHRRSYHGRSVEIRELLDGRLLVLHQGTVLVEQPAPASFTLAPRRSARQHRVSPAQIDAPGSLRIDDHTRPRLRSQARQGGIGTLTNIRRPKPGHVWKRGFAAQQAATRGVTDSVRR